MCELHYVAAEKILHSQKTDHKIIAYYQVHTRSALGVPYVQRATNARSYALDLQHSMT